MTAYKLPIVSSITNNQLSVRKFSKLIGSLEWSLMKLNFDLSLKPYKEEIDIA